MKKLRQLSGVRPFPFLKLSDRGYIIDNDQIRYQGSIEELRANEEVRKKYLLV